MALLEPEASRFSVPSKVLTYLCSNRAIVGVLPSDNSVGEIISRHGAGIVVDPADRRHVAGVVARLLNEEQLCRDMARAGRVYAERTFSPERAADQFLEVFGDAVAEPVEAPAARSAGARAGTGTEAGAGAGAAGSGSRRPTAPRLASVSEAS